METRNYVKVGVGGPVGSGKTALIERLVRSMSTDYSICVVTNDIYTREDASMNIEAVEELATRFPDTELIFVESGGDNLTSTFSPDLADVSIFVIDVGEGEKMPRKGGPGITRSDLLIINKIDLAPYVHADLEVMRQDTLRMRGERPFIFTNLMTLEGLEDVKGWLKKYALLEQ